MLSILASLAAITWPRLSPLLHRSSQRDAALQLAADLADAREQAIRSGDVRELHIYPGTGRYSIGPVAAEVSNPAAHADRRSNPSGQNAASTLSESGSELREWQDASIRELPDGVIFPRNESPFDEDPESASFLAAGFLATSATEDVGPDLSMDWSGNGVLAAQFFPDGRSTDTVVELTRPETRESLVLRLRGLTGAVTIGAVERPTPAAGSVSQELPSANAGAPVEARR